MTQNLTFGEHIRRLRRRKRWGLQQLAEATGLSISHLSRLENDANLPNPETVVKLSEALEDDLEHMLELSNALPQQILDRLGRAATGRVDGLRRTGGSEPDPDFSQSFVEAIDPTIRSALIEAFGLTQHDADGIVNALDNLGRMDPDDRATVLSTLDLLTRRSSS